MAFDGFAIAFRRNQELLDLRDVGRLRLEGLITRPSDGGYLLPVAQPRPQPSQEERNARAVIDEAMRMDVSDWDSDDFVRDRVSAEVLKYASADEKAHMLRCLMDGPTGGDDEDAMLRILQSVNSVEELNQVMARAGGVGNVLGELEGRTGAFINGLKDRGEVGAKMILALARGYGVTDGASDDFVRNYVDANVLSFATDDNRAHMLRCLMDGWTAGDDEAAMLRVLQSARDPESVRQTLAKAGGAPAVLGDLESSQGAFIAHVKSMGREGARLVAEMALAHGISDGASDDFVRNHVDDAVLAECTAEEKVQMLRMLLDGATLIDDEQAVLRILNSARNPAELKTLIEGAGKQWLARDIDDSTILKLIESKIFQVEAAEAPEYRPLATSDDDATVDARLAELEAFLREREGRYDDLDGNFFTQFDQSSRFNKFYSDLKKAVGEDLGKLANWQSLSHDEKVALYNQISHEVHIELKFNVNLTSGDKDWSHDEMRDIEAALKILPPALTLENEQLHNIRRFAKLGEKGDAFAWTKGDGDIEFSDIGVAASYRLTDKGVHPVTETLIHEIGHHFDEENPRWNEFLAIAGWTKLGDDDDDNLAKFETGKTYKGKELGLADAEGDYVIKRRYGETWAHRPDNKTFGVGSYTQNNPYDDFAESLAQFFLDPERFRSLPDKYEFMKNFTGRDPAREAEIKRIAEEFDRVRGGAGVGGVGGFGGIKTPGGRDPNFGWN